MSINIVTRETATALWHEVVHEAEQSCKLILREEIESYLVFLLMRYVDHPEVIKEIMALEFLQGVESTPKMREMMLRDVGDKCLLFAGLFPMLAKARLVKLSYFVEMGQASYFRISRKNNDLYDHLSHQFVPLMDVLQSIRHDPLLLPLDAFELWQETGSQRARAILNQYTLHSK